MRTHLNCASCIVDDLCGALQLIPLEEKIKKEILSESFNLFNFCLESSPQKRFPLISSLKFIES